MRHVAIAIAALGFSNLGHAAKCIPTGTGTATAAPGTVTNKLPNGDFVDGLDGFNTTGTVEHVEDEGYDQNCHDSNGAIMMKVGDDDLVPDTNSIHRRHGGRHKVMASYKNKNKKRAAFTSSSVSTTVPSLTAGVKYTAQFFYYIIYNAKANNCRIQGFFDGKNIANSTYFPVVYVPISNWINVNGTATAAGSTGVFKIVVSCTTGFAEVYIDNISVSKAVATTSSSTSSTASSTRSSTTSSSSAAASSTSLSTVVTSTTASSTSLSTAVSSTAAPSTAASSTAASSTAQSSAASSTAAATSSSQSSAAAAAAAASSSSAQSSAASSTAGSSTAGSSTAGSSTDSGQSSAASSSGQSSADSSTASSATDSGQSTAASSSASSSSTSNPNNAVVDSTILVIASSSDIAGDATLGLLGYGIPYQTLIVSQSGVDLPKLNSSSTRGNFGGIIIMDSIAYEFSTGWASGLTDDQWTALYTYQTSFNVRMVRINEYPGAKFGTTVVGAGCCDGTFDQTVSFTDTSDFPTANLKTKAEVSTAGLWHVPAIITDKSTTKQIAKFGITTGFPVESVAGVINNFNGREQFVWFIGWAPSWSLTSNYLQHAHIHWMTRGVFLGKRKTHLSCQIDDVQISTSLYYPPDSPDFTITIADLEAHVSWQKDFVSRLPDGSNFWLELGHNGNGDIINSTLGDTKSLCKPSDAVYYDSPNGTALEFQKTLGTGVDIWPTGYEKYSWSAACAQLGAFAAWFTVASNRNQFAHVSHTFSHLSLNNATYHDVKREIQFNQAWFAQTGIDQATNWSPNGLIPPAITGLHNGDAIQAWMDNKIIYVVGDNTRPILRNPKNSYWPLITTAAGNGYDGLTIVPRFSTAIYFNCHTMECTLNEWIATSAGKGTYFDLLDASKASSVRNLLALMSDPYMFHQANMHQTTVLPITVGTQTGKMSLVMSWTETMAQELMRLTNWPIKSLKHDDIAKYFLNRQAVDGCNPALSYTYSSDGQSIKAVTVTADGNSCAVPIPVTIPSGSASASGGSATADQVGSEPPIQWVTLSGSPVTLSLSSPVPLL
ncbi:hypothetical protein AK830_g3864 [Neonectria ditissima]|uniref:Extracellular serine-rich protein n=1 Tax=Neonectria ditissima TaxID=78410 RepID=A0A0P7BH66_9HYPO|nr:hypothetical protein AK830_g3864 [Neonectria ditissima]